MLSTARLEKNFNTFLQSSLVTLALRVNEAMCFKWICARFIEITLGNPSGAGKVLQNVVKEFNLIPKIVQALAGFVENISGMHETQCGFMFPETAQVS